MSWKSVIVEHIEEVLLQQFLECGTNDLNIHDITGDLSAFIDDECGFFVNLAEKCESRVELALGPSNVSLDELIDHIQNLIETQVRGELLLFELLYDLKMFSNMADGEVDVEKAQSWMTRSYSRLFYGLDKKRIEDIVNNRAQNFHIAELYWYIVTSDTSSRVYDRSVYEKFAFNVARLFGLVSVLGVIFGVLQLFIAVANWNKV